MIPLFQEIHSRLYLSISRRTHARYLTHVLTKEAPPSVTIQPESSLFPKILITSVIIVVSGIFLISFFGGEALFFLLPLVGGIYFFIASKKRGLAKTTEERALFLLPLVIEQIIMSLRAGNDLVRSMEIVTELEKEVSEKNNKKLDPVCLLFSQILEDIRHGLTLGESIDSRQISVTLPALRHTLLYLKTSWLEGGDLIAPLLELGDATQSAYQDMVEEQLATLPIKAMLPLLITFSGLLLILLSSPIVALLKFTTAPELP